MTSRMLQLRRRLSPAALLIAASVALALAQAAAAYQQAEPAKPVFEDGQAQVVEAFNDSNEWIREQLWVETEFDTDGNGKPDRVHVDVTRQKQTDTEGLKVPVIYNTSPYFAGTAGGSDFFWDARHELGETPPVRKAAPDVGYRAKVDVISNSLVNTWVPRGFAVVHSSSPGTGLSQGCPTVGGINESLAPKAVIDWLNGRARGFTSPDGDEEIKATWCTGKVGMIGTSYNGTLPVAAATTGVEGLAAIIPVAPNTSYYHYYRSNGLVRHPGGYLGEDIDVLYDFINSGDPAMREYCDCEVRDKDMAEGMDRITGDYNDFWAGRDYLNQMDNWHTPTLMAHAFNDWNVMPEHSVRIAMRLKEMGVPVQWYFHQGGHGGNPPMEMQNKWFSRYLYGIDNGVEDDPKAWIVREGDRRNDPTAYPDYPHPDAQMVKMYPTGDGSTHGDLAITAPRTTRGTQKVVDDVSLSGAELAQADQSKHRLLFATPKLTRDVHTSGTGRITIKVASSKPAVNLSVWLVSLPYESQGRRTPITNNIITRGWADPQNRNDLRTSSPLKPGEFVELTFELQPDDQIIPAGQQIGLMIFSSDRDFTLWPDPGTELTVDLDATMLELPIVGGLRALAEATTGAN